MAQTSPIENTEEQAATGPKYKAFTHDFFDSFSEQDVSVSLRFAQPGAKSTERAQKQMMKSPTLALKNLCAGSVHPDDKALMTEKFEAFPGLASTFGGALLKACGFGDLGN
ncbi:hypothetical protein DO021_19650 [Desulfobacter hydrogenophilus]|uniref:DUF6848 domain-containing protein n=1 Tax=Desulfobacter hydrogenophilus TaxID=2291 RepID=A0A328F6W0_9BACT|nr:hypothetical protein [Desulfobacter hydrogenophilus]NDY73987.1 hypothetical protein [Desulfobacter hydrogenophilus]QBH14332.1 hypothetical protein EYB58_16250 [Desulfobacter hydrogenophilus]RAM00334.1 hypothetical protein DO021_19650 [Desulfobacter hydrogenophilus]